MCSHPARYRLFFLLPAGLRIDPCWFEPNADGCALSIEAGLVQVTGPSRAAVFDQAAVLLRLVHRAKPAAVITATLESPVPAPGRDGWSIIVGAPIAFSPTSLDPYFPARFR